ncbi:hypothetical protein [Nocardia cyriacigeorgica]|uniref:hypothetical protein n=1 Tax=Nocardia cyriacigeorgica TaxID=135487 RepID=UPI00245465D2|nr:hypothetical protein [Nocardia cyriacigeorgica]
MQQLAHRVAHIAAFECGDLVRDGLGRDSQQPGQACGPIRRSVRAGEIDFIGMAVQPGVGLGEGDGGHGGREGMMPDEFRGGVAQRTLL